MTSSKNPLAAKHIRSESKKSSLLKMQVPDTYYSVSEMPLRERIDRSKQHLCGIYADIANFRNDPNVDDDNLINAYLAEYEKLLNCLKDGKDATNCEIEFNESLPPIFETTFCQNWFSAATTWLVCAELLETNGLPEKAWSTLIEYAGAECQLLHGLDKELELKNRKHNQRSGGKSYAMYHNLRNYLIEFLETKAGDGWKTKESTAHYLAPYVLERHNDSEKASVYRISVEEVEIKINSWLKNHQPCIDAYNARKA